VTDMLKLKSIEGLSSESAKSYALFLCACGYEERARHVANQLSIPTQRRVALGFTEQQVLCYSSNKQAFLENDFEVLEISDAEFRNRVDRLLVEIGRRDDVIEIGVDISCMSRFRLAHLVDAIRSIDCETVKAAFYYSIAKYTPPIVDAAPTVTVEPVIPQFAGWSVRPDKPPAAVVGLGYEPNKAIGVIDHLEINNATWAYYPESPVSEYISGVLEANTSLLKLIQVDGRCRPYLVTEPAPLYHELNSLVDVLKGSFNPILIPFGPKVFALVALLVACVHDDIGVWRVSSGLLETPVNRQASEHVVLLRVTFGCEG
jgi:hypothetical protein